MLKFMHFYCQVCYPTRMSDDLMLTVGKRVKQARLLADLSQEDLGKQVGMVQSAVSALERGERPTTVQEIERLAAVLDKPTLWFLANEDERPPAPRSLRSGSRNLPPEAVDEVINFILWVEEKYGRK